MKNENIPFWHSDIFIYSVADVGTRDIGMSIQNVNLSLYSVTDDDVFANYNSMSVNFVDDSQQ